MSHGYSGKLIASNEYSELQRLEDFEGKTIGVQASTGVHTVFQMAIDRIGLTDSDFDIRNVGVQDMPAADSSHRLTVNFKRFQNLRTIAAA